MKEKLADLVNAVKKFDEEERRKDFFGCAENLLKDGYEAEAYIFLLATWNFAGFRYGVTKFDIESFKKTIERLKEDFKKLENEEFEKINFANYKDNISKIFKDLSSFAGMGGNPIGYTGASKIMHLKKPKIFIMWDRYIRGEKSKKYYKHLEMPKWYQWKKPEYKTSGEGYIQFLKDMQGKFNNINAKELQDKLRDECLNPDKNITKAIDEFNYVSITLPIQKKEKEDKKTKKETS